MMDEPVVVFSSHGPLEAEVVKSKLSSEGILSMLRYQAVGRVLGITINGLGLVEVLVAPDDEERARAILEMDSEGDGAEDLEYWEEDEDEDEQEEIAP